MSKFVTIWLIYCQRPSEPFFETHCSYRFVINVARVFFLFVIVFLISRYCFSTFSTVFSFFCHFSMFRHCFSVFYYCFLANYFFFLSHFCHCSFLVFPFFYDCTVKKKNLKVCDYIIRFTKIKKEAVLSQGNRAMPKLFFSA